MSAPTKHAEQHEANLRQFEAVVQTGAARACGVHAAVHSLAAAAADRASLGDVADRVADRVNARALQPAPLPVRRR